jgi:hypothetical protein
VLNFTFILTFSSPPHRGASLTAHKTSTAHNESTPVARWHAQESISVLIAFNLAAISAAVVLLGPGAFSLDARLFGRREIVIPEGAFTPPMIPRTIPHFIQIERKQLSPRLRVKSPSKVVSDAHPSPALKIPSFAGCNLPSLPS